MRRTTGAGECAVTLQRCRERDPARDGDLVILAGRTQLPLRHEMLFPTRFEPASLFESAEGRVDGTAGQSGDSDHVEAMLVTVRHGLQQIQTPSREADVIAV